MNESVRSIARRILPRRALRMVRAWRGGSSVRYSDGYADWQAAQRASTGYDAPDIVARVAIAARQVRLGLAAYERDAVLFDSIQYSWPVLAGLMHAAARGRGRLDVLDFGGSLGTAYMQNRRFLEGIEVSWHIVEQPDFVKVGRREFENGHVRFFETAADAIACRQPNALLLGGVLQFLEEPHAVLRELSTCDAGVMIVDRTPFREGESDAICVQHVGAGIYPATYPFRVFSWRLFREGMAALGWRVLETFAALEGERETDSGAPLSFRGAILVRDAGASA